MYRRYLKRIIDVIAASGALIVFSPILLLTSVWLHFANKGAGAFFFQERPGLKGKIFRIVKFKTMTDERDANGNLLPDEDRLTAVGRFVRSTSIDELPQLWNVVKGDMSLIGPRPLLPRYMPYYTKVELHRHDVRPGITGYAQSHGRNTINWDEKLSMDVWYVNNLSFKLDMAIFVQTLISVIKRESVEVAGVEALDNYRIKQNNSRIELDQ